MLGAVDGLAVLDLYAGSGALAIEALSRGAGQATLVDRSAAALAVISRNLSELKLTAEVVRQDARTFLERARKAGRQYDLLFLDPPYRHASQLGAQLGGPVAALTAPGGRVVSESDRRSPLALELPLQLERRYGDTLIRIHGSR